MQAQTQFIVHGVHITENLLHHKLNDVRRILEDKGFNEDSSAGSGDGSVRFYPPAGTPEDGRQTIIRFGDGGFVEDDGVSHSG